MPPPLRTGLACPIRGHAYPYVPLWSLDCVRHVTVQQTRVNASMLHAPVVPRRRP